MVYLNYQTEPEIGKKYRQLYKLMTAAMSRYLVVMMQQVNGTVKGLLFLKQMQMAQSN